MRRARQGGPGRQPHQLLALPPLHVPGHHVAVALQPDAGVSRRAHLSHSHAHRQGDAEPGQLQQVSPRLPASTLAVSVAPCGVASFILVGTLPKSGTNTSKFSGALLIELKQIKTENQLNINNLNCNTN